MGDLEGRIKVRKVAQIDENEIETKGLNVVELKTVTGGKGPTDYHPNDWLSPLADGTIFLFHKKKDPFESNLGQAKILSRTEKAIYLGFIINGQPMQGPVDPVKFCNVYGMFENLGTLIEEGELHDDERDRLQGDSTGEAGTLAGNETLQGMPDGTPPSRG